MVSCVVVRCRNCSGKISKNKDGITFHRFPRDKVRKKKWEIAVNRELGWRSSASSTVCSEHFDAKDFYLTESGLRKLSQDAIPSINISACQDYEPTISDSDTVVINPNDSEEVVQLKCKVRRLEELAEMRKRKLNLMWQGKKRLRKKFAQMKYLLKHMIRYDQYKEEQSNSQT
ncbi:PREDICTED: THAP domain-containing protein 1-like [Papilio xuthus]|uniref:THAP domain-containing protein 1-like n=1 Tax=Papilio xuthus TaxID=66420 RepID=A0A194Q3V2_PAPXU|nr:PREDICTED: THAP domain-containing protein 1-like [Papilio xuthus]KPI98085.1 THAP domain-containing protein 9 [Papilio xuthus]